MVSVLAIAISIHVLATVFWAGSAIVIARNDGAGAEQLFRPQMAAAVIAIISGGYLWNALHEGSFGAMEKSLGLGAICAVLALAAQILLTGSGLRRDITEKIARRRSLFANRIVAVLLAIATIAMAAARYL